MKTKPYYKTAHQLFVSYFSWESERFSTTMLNDRIVSGHIDVSTSNYICSVLSDVFNSKLDEYALIMTHNGWRIVRQAYYFQEHEQFTNSYIVATSNQIAILNNIASKFIFDNMLQHNMDLIVKFTDRGVVYGYACFHAVEETYDIIFKDMVKLCLRNPNYKYMFVQKLEI